METTTLLNYTPHYLMGVPESQGKLFGVELELEGRNVGLRDVATKGWHRHEEPSLRGESIEYSTSSGKNLDECQELVVSLFKKFKDNGVVFNNSVRTSTHVHLNFTDKKIKQAINFFALFTMLEELLQYYSGEDRKGNLFCISTRDAEGIVGVLSSGLSRGSLDQFAGDRYKYAACNLSTLYKFGTIEVRTMRGANSAEQVNKWLSILSDLYDYSLKMESPAALINEFSHKGVVGFLLSVFSKENYEELMSAIPAVCNVHHSLMEGARIIQIFAYEFEEDFKAEVKMEEIVGDLPVLIKDGRFVERTYQIYRPDGRRWNVQPRRIGHRVPMQVDFWRDGDVVLDELRIEWSSARQRFIVRYPNDEIVECRWSRHHNIPDEGPPDLLRDMPLGGGVPVDADGFDEGFEEEADWPEEEEPEEDF